MRFNHIFKLTNENETHREYKCDDVNINIDFISAVLCVWLFLTITPKCCRPLP